MTLLLLGSVLLLCLLPSLLFLGFWHGLLRLQRGSLVTRARKRAGHTDPAVTWGDVIDAYADPKKRLFRSASGSTAVRDEQCSACATDTAPFATFCHNCFRKLE